MTGQSWRHFSVFWPFTVAGALGPANVEQPAELDGAVVAPTDGRLQALAPDTEGSSGTSSGTSSDDDSNSEADAASDASKHVHDGWRAVPGDEFAVEDEPLCVLPDEDVASESNYKHIFPGMAVHDAFLETFCRAIRLGGMLFSDNTANPNVFSEAQINQMEDSATELGADVVQTLYGHVNTTKLHRLIHHMSDELRARGNLWGDDTSVNKKLHGSCKTMFKRSNKRGPAAAPQMMRCDEAQSSILRELVDAD
eukprot:TRINITY_DN3673_c0_g1_i10.p2 TRINITY_DN3673_c0_g1~~TRINITY_DN3673_c0_g1_i10.p2  ORF type:complete len:253 (-),score=54.75 TRINITY_DN3673_c0_g1_i10:1138-1896(-)